MFFPENFVIFLNSDSSTAALVFYLPGVCTHTDTEGKQGWEFIKESNGKQGFLYIQGVHCVFFKDFIIFQTLVFLCFRLVSVCVHTPGR